MNQPTPQKNKDIQQSSEWNFSRMLRRLTTVEWQYDSTEAGEPRPCLVPFSFRLKRLSS